VSDLNDRPTESEPQPLATLTIRNAADLAPADASRVARWLETQASHLRQTAERANYAPRYRARIWR